MKYFKDWDEVIGSVKSLKSAKRVVVAAGQDEHSIEAVAEASKDGLIFPVLVGDKSQIDPLVAKYSIKA